METRLDELLKEWSDVMGCLEIDLSNIPDYMRDALALWVVRGIQPGSFLSSVLSNDLKASFACADDQNSRCMKEWVETLHAYAPNGSCGSIKNFVDWSDQGGLRGIVT